MSDSRGLGLGLTSRRSPVRIRIRPYCNTLLARRLWPHGRAAVRSGDVGGDGGITELPPATPPGPPSPAAWPPRRVAGRCRAYGVSSSRPARLLRGRLAAECVGLYHWRSRSFCRCWSGPSSTGAGTPTGWIRRRSSARLDLKLPRNPRPRSGCWEVAVSPRPTEAF